METIAATHVEPDRVSDLAAAPARPAPRPVVLQTAAHAVGRAHVEADVVELAERHRVDEIPVATPVPALPYATIVAHHDVIAIIWIDPHGVMIDVQPDRRVAGRAT